MIIDDITLSEITNIWDNIQKEMKCCGVNNYKDWTNPELNTTFPQNGFDVPESCCADVEDLNDCRDNPNDEKYAKNMKGSEYTNIIRLDTRSCSIENLDAQFARCSKNLHICCSYRSTLDFDP